MMKVIYIFAAAIVACAMSGCKNEFERFLKIPAEQMTEQRDRAEKILKKDICPKLAKDSERAICENLMFKISMTTIGILFVSANSGCKVIYIEPLSIVLSEFSLMASIAHEVGHIILGSCGEPKGRREIAETEADLFAASIVGKTAVIGLLEEASKIYINPEDQKKLLKVSADRRKILALSGW